MANANSQLFKTPEARGGFVHLYEKETDVNNVLTDKNSMKLLFPKVTNEWWTDLPWLWAAIGEVLVQQWPNGQYPVDVNNLCRHLVVDGDTKHKSDGTELAGFPGNWAVRVASNRFDPAVNLMAADGSIPTATQIYSGAYYIVQAQAYAINKQGWQICLSMENVLKTRDGESLGGGGGMDASDAFGIQRTGAAGAFAGQTPGAPVPAPTPAGQAPQPTFPQPAQVPGVPQAPTAGGPVVPPDFLS